MSNFFAAVYLAVLIGTLVLALLVMLRGSKELVNRLFLLFALTVFLWIGANYLLTVFHDDFITLNLLRGTFAFVAVLALSLMVFVFHFPQVISRRANTYSLIAVIPAVAAIGLAFSPTVVQNFTRRGDVISAIDYGPGLIPFFVYISLILIVTFAALYRQYRQAKGVVKQQALFLFIGLGLFAGSAFIADLVIPGITGSTVTASYDPIWAFFILGFAAYAILKHHLMTVRVITTEVLVVLIMLILLIQALLSTSWSEGILRGSFFLVVGYLGVLLIRSVIEETQRREQIEKLAQEKTLALKEVEERNKNLAALQKVSEIVLNENDMKVMAQKILDELPTQLDSCIGALLSIVRDGNLVAYAISSSPFTDRIHSLVGMDLEKYSYPIKKDFNLMHNAIVDHKAMDSENLSDFISPPIPKPVAFAIQKFVRSQHIEAIPLYASGEPFGVMMFVFTRDRQAIHGKNFEIAKSISDEMSLAIQRAQASQKLKEANEYLAQMDKMKDEFISMASHELNTPLAAIEGYLSMILDEGMGGKIDAKTREYLSRAYASSKRLAELILDLLNVSRIEQGRLKMKFSQVNLGELAESVIHELQIKADSKKVYLKVETDKAKLPLTWCDPDRIREVFVNLTGNALKFTEKGGVTIRITPGADGKTIIGSVTDTGRGIAKEDQKKLFQKFSQVKREIDEHQGTGLGLYISKNFVDLHNGRLWVESDAGRGATFSFELPVLDKAPVEVEGAILEKPINSPQIEQGNKDVPQIITDSAKVGSEPPTAPATPPTK